MDEQELNETQNRVSVVKGNLPFIVLVSVWNDSVDGCVCDLAGQQR